MKIVIETVCGRNVILFPAIFQSPMLAFHSFINFLYKQVFNIKKKREATLKESFSFLAAFRAEIYVTALRRDLLNFFFIFNSIIFLVFTLNSEKKKRIFINKDEMWQNLHRHTQTHNERTSLMTHYVNLISIYIQIF